MARPVLDNVLSSYSSAAKINSNNEKIEVGFADSLSRNDSSANNIKITLDMDSNPIINLPTPTLDHEAATKEYVDDILAAIDGINLGLPVSINLGGTGATSASQARDNLGIVNAVGFLTNYKLPGYTDTQALQAWVASGDKYVCLVEDITLTAEIAIGYDCILDLKGNTIFKGYNGNMFTMAAYARIENGRIDGMGATYSGNGITISGGVTNRNQRLKDLDIINTRGWNLEFVGDGSGASFSWVSGSYYRYDTSLSAVKGPDAESATTGLRTFIGLIGNGAPFMDVCAARVTRLCSMAVAAMTFSDDSAYTLIDNSRIVQFIDRRAVATVTKTNPGVVTSVNHGLKNGNSVSFYDVVGMTELNGNNYTVANVTADTFELSGTNTTSYGAFASGIFKNRSTHMIRGNNHRLQGILGTSLDGSSTMTLAKNAEYNIVDVPHGITLIDDSTNTLNRTSFWFDRVKQNTAYTLANGWLAVSQTADNQIGYQLLENANARLTIGTDSSANVEITSRNGVNLELGVDSADDLIISATAITSTLPLILPTSTPASAAATGVAGTVAWDASYIYICTAANTWKRVAIATW